MTEDQKLVGVCSAIALYETDLQSPGKLLRRNGYSIQSRQNGTALTYVDNFVEPVF